MVRRLAEGAHSPGEATGDNGSPGAGEAPLRVFLVVSSAMLFPRGADLAPLPSMEQRDLRIYHLRFQVGPANLYDELHRILKPLGPRTFTMDSAMDVRRALGEILRELRKL